MVILLLCNDCWLKQKNRHGFDVNSMTAATVVYEGNQDEVLLKQRKPAQKGWYKQRYKSRVLVQLVQLWKQLVISN